MQKLRIIVSCTARKRVANGSFPRLRSVKGDSASARADAWAELVASERHRTPAVDVYLGEYWRTAVGFADPGARGQVTEMSVISAGLGVIDADESIPAYGATFASGHPDSVVMAESKAHPSEARRTWWDAITSIDVLGEGKRRRVRDLDVSDADTAVVVCVGRTYLDAVVVDLLQFVAQLSGPSQLLVFGSGGSFAGLEEHWVEVPGALRLVLGGSLASTGLRAAQAAVKDAKGSAITPDLARASIARLTADAGPLPTFDRQRLGDGAILEWIIRHLDKKPASTKSAALRDFRTEGNACEQARFGRLFEEAQETMG